MGDTDQKPETPIEPAEDCSCEEAKPSMDILKEVKPSENISIEPNNPSLDNLETSFKPSEATVSEPEAEKPADDEEKVAEESKEEAKDKSRNRSDIFSLNENNNLPSTIFSVSGAPAKTIQRSVSVGSNKTSTSTETIATQSSSSSKQSQLRNPLTGIGVSSNDEFKNKPSKRRDGNPLLGVGYKDDNPVPPSGQRIPPGGYSQGLW